MATQSSLRPTADRATSGTMYNTQSSPAAVPLHPAPARFGQAGLSAGEEHLIKTHIPEDTSHLDWTTPAPAVIAEGLGWFSIGLGIAELLAADRISRSLGMEDKRNLIRLYGMREIGQGIGLLAQTSPPGHARWLRIRAAGDTLDMATLATGLSSDNQKRTNVMLAMAAVGGVAMLDLIAAALCAER